jgi:hypothetical protein
LEGEEVGPAQWFVGEAVDLCMGITGRAVKVALRNAGHEFEGAKAGEVRLYVTEVAF